MIVNEPIKFSGVLDIVKYDEHGNVTQKMTVPNLVVDTGKTLVAKLVSGAVAATSPTHMAVGASNTAAAAAQTGLLSESARVALTTKTASSNVMSFIAIYPAGTGTGTLQEAGLFNAASSGEMLCRSLFTSAITKGVNDTVSITWTITVS